MKGHAGRSTVSGVDAQTAIYEGTMGFAAFIDDFITMAQHADEKPVKGQLAVWVVKAAYDAETRRTQLRMMVQSITDVLGPQPWDLKIHLINDSSNQ